MPWFKRQQSYVPVRSVRRRSVQADGKFMRCPKCGEILYKADLENNLFVCAKCRHHFRIGARQRLDYSADPGTFEETHAGLRSVDPLKFRAGSVSYADKITESQAGTGLEEAAISGRCTIGGVNVSLAITDSFFMMGSMGSVVGEKITRTIEDSITEKLPLVCVSGSGGGARMQEGTLSLMQMAKISSALAQLHEQRLPYLSVLTDPTMGGTAASFGMMGDVILAEPGAMIGFAGDRTRDAIRQKLPEGFQTAEFLLEKGFIDLVVPRVEMKETVACLLTLLAA